MHKTPLDRFIESLRCSVMGHCPRRLAASALYPEANKKDESGEVDVRFRDGHWHEYDVKMSLLRDNVRFESGIKTVTDVEFDLTDCSVRPGLTIPGHLDGIVQADGTSKLVPPGRWLLEVKSMNSGSFWQLLKKGYQEAFPSYYDQIQAYLDSIIVGEGYNDSSSGSPIATLYHDLDYEEEEDVIGEIPDTAIIVAKNKDSGQLKVLPVEYDESYAAGLRERWLTAIEQVDAGRLPTRLHETPDNYECRGCPIRYGCWGEAIPVVKEALPPTQDQEAAAKMYQFGKTLERFGGQLQDAARPVLEPAVATKIKIGPAIVTKYPTKHTSWNHKLLERMLTQEQLESVKATKDGFATRIDVEDMTPEELTQSLSVLSVTPPKQLRLLEEVTR